MTRNKNISVCYCRKCIDPLLNYGEILMSCYETICEFYSGNEFALPIEETKCGPGTMTMVRFLELKGFVTTTELTDDICIVKPNFHSYSKKGHLYCCDPAIHCPEFVKSVD